MDFIGEVEITTLADHRIRVEAEIRYEDTSVFERRIELTDYHIIRAEVIRNGRRRSAGSRCFPACWTAGNGRGGGICSLRSNRMNFCRRRLRFSRSRTGSCRRAIPKPISRRAGAIRRRRCRRQAARRKRIARFEEKTWN